MVFLIFCTLSVFFFNFLKISRAKCYFFLTPYPPFCSTEPGVVGNLNVIGTTTSSVYLSWTQPKGNSSFYRVEGTGVSMNTTETSTTISGLTAGVQYNFTVTTVAGDKTTVGEGNTTATFTSKSSFKFGVV
jgi:hypothetical protein